MRISILLWKPRNIGVNVETNFTYVNFGLLLLFCVIWTQLITILHGFDALWLFGVVFLRKSKQGRLLCPVSTHKSLLHQRTVDRFAMKLPNPVRPGKYLLSIERFSHDVTAAIFGFQNNETAAMLVYTENPLGVELFSHVNAFFCSNKLAWKLATWVKTLYRTIARCRHFTTTTRILLFAVFLCKLRPLFFKAQWNWQI